MAASSQHCHRQAPSDPLFDWHTHTASLRQHGIVAGLTHALLTILPQALPRKRRRSAKAAASTVDEPCDGEHATLHLQQSVQHILSIQVC
jgi:hypothetical protein